jgi:UDP-glucuronate 4-epimerase
MALFKFTKAIVNNETINVNNNGNHLRDFTYIDDIVNGIKRMIASDEPRQNESEIFTSNSSKAPWKIYNIGNNNPTHLIKFIELIEKYLNKKAKINFVPLQPGDVQNTYANVDDLIRDFGYKPDTKIENGIKKFIDWYKLFYDVK